jgi:hypothetical protein
VKGKSVGGWQVPKREEVKEILYYLGLDKRIRSTVKVGEPER